ncbi:MAG TPA: TolC family protein, partial [Chloroflexota bacterium]|nr:TolC family protein [Chloroflexota bacterium]
SMGQTKTSGDRIGPQNTLVPILNPAWSYSTGLSASVNVFDGGRRLSDLRARKADEDVAEANEVTTKFNVALQVKTQYANILAARESEAAARAQLQQAEQQLRTAAAKVAAGASTRSDSLRQVIQVGNARLALLTAQNNLRTASAALTRLVGTPFFVTAQPSDTIDAPLPAIDSATLASLASAGPTVQAAQAALASARAAERSSKTTYFPSVDLRYSRNGSGFDKYYGLGAGDLAYGSTWSLNLSYPLFNNFSREDAVLRTGVAVANAEANLRDAQFAAQQGIIQQFGALRTAEERVRIQQASVIAAQEDLRVQQQRYTLGASTLLDVLTSQTTLDNARAALIQARQDYRLARAQIEAIIGRDLQ